MPVRLRDELGVMVRVEVHSPRPSMISIVMARDTTSREARSYHGGGGQVQKGGGGGGGSQSLEMVKALSVTVVW